MLFVTDLEYATKASASKKITTINIGLQNEMMLNCCQTFQVEGDSRSDIIRNPGEGARRPGNKPRTTVHIWLCMRCMYPSGGTVKLTENSFKNFTQDFIEVIDKIAGLLNRPIMLNVRPTSEFFGTGRMDSRSFLVDLILKARSLNVIGTIKSRVWRTMWSLSQSSGSIPHMGLSRNSIWAIIEKHLCRERLLSCAMDPTRVGEINKIAEDDTVGSLSPADHDKYINTEMPKVYSDAPADGEDAIGGTIGEESEWKDIQFAMKDPEPEYDPTYYWLRGNRNTDRLTVGEIHLPHLCGRCRKDDYSNERTEYATNPRTCVNSNFNFWCRQGTLHSIGQEKEYIFGNQPFE